MNTKSSSIFGSGVTSVWFGASLSVSGIFPGASVSAAGTSGGIAAILTGSLFGCCFLFLSALAGSLPERAPRALPDLPDDTFREQTRLPAQFSLRPGLFLFAFLTPVILILQAALTVRFAVFLSSNALTFGSSVSVLYDDGFPHLSAYALFVLIIALSLICFFLPPKPAVYCRRILILCSAAVSLLLCGVLLFFAGSFSSYETAAVIPSGFRLSFKEAASLSACTSFTWSPFFFLLFYNMKDIENAGQRTMRHAAAGSILFFAGSCLLQLTGFFFVRYAGITKLIETFSISPARVFWILLSVLSAVMTVWFCIFSAAESSVTIYCRRMSEKKVSCALLTITAAASLLLRTEQLESASKFFTMLVLPFLGVYLAAFAADFLLKKISERFVMTREIPAKTDTSDKIRALRIRNGDVLSVLLCALGFLILKCTGYRIGSLEKSIGFFAFFTLFCTAARVAFLCYQEEYSCLKSNIKIYLENKTNQENRKYHENRSISHPPLRRNRQKHFKKQNTVSGCGRSHSGRGHDDSAAGKNAE